MRNMTTMLLVTLLLASLLAEFQPTNLTPRTPSNTPAHDLVLTSTSSASPNRPKRAVPRQAAATIARR